MKYLIQFCFAIIFSSLMSQPTQFIKTYGDVCHDMGLSLDLTVDGGYVLLGHSENFGASLMDIYLIKVDSTGMLEWQRVYGGAHYDFGQSVIQANDKGYVICGFTNSFGLGGYDIYIIKTDSIGNIEWEKTFGGTNNDYGYCIRQTVDNGFIISGSTNSFGSGGFDAILIKTDSLGNEEWSKYYGGVSNDGCYALEVTSDNGFILAGYTYSFGALSDDAMLIKTDSLGNTEWLEMYGFSNSERALSVKQTNDNGYIAVGSTNSIGNGSDDIYLIRTNSTGDLLYFKSFGAAQSDKAFSIDIANDNGYVIIGQTTSYGAGNEDLYVVKVDSLGNFLWQKTYGGLNNDRGFTIKTTNDNGYIAIGTTYSYSSYYSYVFLVKMDSEGDAVHIEKNIFSEPEIIVYPNPVKEHFIVQVQNDENIKYISIYNTLGQEVFYKELNQNAIKVDFSDKPSGLYFVNISMARNIKTMRIIKE